MTMRVNAANCAGLSATAVVLAILTGCGGGPLPPPASLTPTTTSTPAPVPTATPSLQDTGVIQGRDNNGKPYGKFNVTLKVAPHLSAADVNGEHHAPFNPLQSDGSCLGPPCEPAGQQYILFTLTFTNPTAAPEEFGTVGFTSALGSLVYPAVASADQGMTPVSSFGGPTNGLEAVTEQNAIDYWQSSRKGPGDAFGFSEPFATSHFLFEVTRPTNLYAPQNNPPGILAPGQSRDVGFSTTGVVAPTSPVRDLTLWVGANPQQVH